jgi:hypothetical protein
VFFRAFGAFMPHTFVSGKKEHWQKSREAVERP